MSADQQAQLKIRTLLSGKATGYAKRVADFVFANLTPVAGKGEWSNPDIDPIDQLDEQLDALSLDVASTENINVVMSVAEWRAIRANPKIKARLNLTGNMALTRQMFTDALLFPVNLEISGVAYTATKRGQSTVTKARAAAGYCIIAHTVPGATTDDASAFKCFSTSPVLVDGVKTYREENSNSEIHSMDWDEDIKKTGDACARLIAVT
jgi:ribosomal protein S13